MDMVPNNGGCNDIMDMVLQYSTLFYQTSTRKTPHWI